MKTPNLTTVLKLPSAMLALATLASPMRGAEAINTAPPASSPSGQEVTLEECLKTAMENNHQRPASRYALALVEAAKAELRRTDLETRA